MKLRLSFAVLLAIALLGTTPYDASAELWTVEVGNFFFNPAILTVQDGDTVKWQWVGGFHTTTSGDPCSADGLWDAPITSSNQTFQRVFNNVGDFPYFCIPHCGGGMTGNITVEMALGVFEYSNDDGIPGSFALDQNYPNPFNAGTVISYILEKGGHTSLKVFDILGREVITLLDDQQAAGRYGFSWDGRDARGTPLASGVYFYRLQTGQSTETRRMILLR
jgi:plastocyanin